MKENRELEVMTNTGVVISDVITTDIINPVMKGKPTEGLREAVNLLVDVQAKVCKASRQYSINFTVNDNTNYFNISMSFWDEQRSEPVLHGGLMIPKTVNEESDYSIDMFKEGVSDFKQMLIDSAKQVSHEVLVWEGIKDDDRKSKTSDVSSDREND